MSHDEATSLALTPWGSSTLEALQASTEAEREEVARRACEEAVDEARTMASLQGSLFEKLLVIERFGLYRAHGCESIQEFLERAVAPVVQMHRGTLHRLKNAVWEAGRLLQEYGTVKADWSHLSLLAGETRRQERGHGALAADEYAQVSRQVAEGALTQRDLLAALQKRRPPSRPRRIDATTPARVPPRRSPFEELAQLAVEARRTPARPTADVGRILSLADQMGRELEQLSVRPADAWRLPALERARLVDVLDGIVERSSAVIAAAKAGCAA